MESTGRGSSKTRTVIDFIICTSLLFNRYRLLSTATVYRSCPPLRINWIGKLYGKKLPYAGVSRLLFKTWSDLKEGCKHPL